MRCRTRRPPSCHQPWVRPVSSRSLSGSVKKIWQETAKTAASPKPSSRGARKSGATRMSLFSRTTMSFLAARKPALEPPPNPRFLGRARTATSGKVSRRKSALPSVDPLSTTRIWLSGLPASALRMLGRYLARRSFPFQFGMTTVAQALLPAASALMPTLACDTVSGPRTGVERSLDTAGTSACATSAGGGILLPRRVKSCTNHSARKLIAMRNGESTSSGSARMRRFRKAMSERGSEAYFAAQPDPSGSAHHVEQLFELALLFLQAKRRGRALLQVFFGLLQGGGSLGQGIGDFTDLGCEVGLGIERPLGFLAVLLLQGGNLGVVTGHYLASIFLVARQSLLKFADARAALGQGGVQLLRPAVALLQFFFLFAEHDQQLLVLAVEFGQIRLRLVEPLVLGGQLAFQLGDMALALAQHVGDARHVKKSGVADLRAVRADGEEEVALAGDWLGRIHPGFYGVAGLVRLEGDAFDVVFQEHGDVREELFELAGEFVEIEFVNVERVGAEGAARFGVIEPVGRGDDQLAGGRQHAPHFLEKGPPVCQVLDDFEGHHQIEDAVAAGRFGARCLLEGEIGQRVVGAGVLDGCGRDIDGRDALRYIGQFRRSVAGAATGIQDALATGQAHREVVARHVLVEQVDIHFAGDEAFAGELSQGDSPCLAPGAVRCECAR